MSKLISGAPGTGMSAILWYVGAEVSADAGVAELPASTRTAATTRGPRNFVFMRVLLAKLSGRDYRRRVPTECLARCFTWVCLLQARRSIADASPASRARTRVVSGPVHVVAGFIRRSRAIVSTPFRTR